MRTTHIPRSALAAVANLPPFNRCQSVDVPLWSATLPADDAGEDLHSRSHVEPVEARSGDPERSGTPAQMELGV